MALTPEVQLMAMAVALYCLAAAKSAGAAEKPPRL